MTIVLLGFVVLLCGAALGSAPPPGCFDVDFESLLPGPLGSGEVLAAGGLLVVVTDPPTGWTAVADGSADPLYGSPVIIDSGSVPAALASVGSPNERCNVSGPGSGSSGQPGTPFENCRPQGLVLGLAVSPHAGGGAGEPLALSFGPQVFRFVPSNASFALAAVAVLGARVGPTTVSCATDYGRRVDFVADTVPPSANGLQLIETRVARVASSEVRLEGPGAVAWLRFCDAPDPLTVSFSPLSGTASSGASTIRAVATWSRPVVSPVFEVSAAPAGAAVTVTPLNGSESGGYWRFELEIHPPPLGAGAALEAVDVTVLVPAGAAVAADLGDVSEVSAPLAVRFDSAPPAYNLSAVPPGLNASSGVVALEVSFAEPVTPVVPGSPSHLVFDPPSVVQVLRTEYVGPSRWKIEVQIAVWDVTVTAHMKASEARDRSGNTNADGSSRPATMRRDSAPPAATVRPADGASSLGADFGTVPLEVVFSERVVTVLAVPLLLTASAGVTVLSVDVVGADSGGGSRVWSVRVAPPAAGPFSVSVAAGAARDDAGRACAASDSFAFVHAPPPALRVSLSHRWPLPPQPDGREPAVVTATFSEPVAGGRIDVSQVRLSSGAALANVTYVDPSTFLVAVEPPRLVVSGTTSSPPATLVVELLAGTASGGNGSVPSQPARIEILFGGAAAVPAVGLLSPCLEVAGSGGAVDCPVLLRLPEWGDAVLLDRQLIVAEGAASPQPSVTDVVPLGPVPSSPAGPAGLRDFCFGVTVRLNRSAGALQHFQVAVGAGAFANPLTGVASAGTTVAADILYDGAPPALTLGSAGTPASPTVLVEADEAVAIRAGAGSSATAAQDLATLLRVSDGAETVPLEATTVEAGRRWLIPLRPPAGARSLLQLTVTAPAGAAADVVAASPSPESAPLVVWSDARPLLAALDLVGSASASPLVFRLRLGRAPSRVPVPSQLVAAGGRVRDVSAVASSSGRWFLVEVVPDAPGPVSVSLLAGAVADAGGVGCETASSNATYVSAGELATELSWANGSAVVTGGGQLVASVAFAGDEPVSPLDEGAVLLTGAVLAAAAELVSGPAGAEYRLTLSPVSDQVTVGLTVRRGAVHGLVSGKPSAAAFQSALYDARPPSVALSARGLAASGRVPRAVVEVVAAFDDTVRLRPHPASKIAVGPAGASVTSVGWLVVGESVLVVVDASGVTDPPAAGLNLTVAVVGGMVEDAAGNGNLPSSGALVVWADWVPPSASVVPVAGPGDWLLLPPDDPLPTVYTREAVATLRLVSTEAVLFGPAGVPLDALDDRGLRLQVFRLQLSGGVSANFVANLTVTGGMSADGPYSQHESRVALVLGASPYVSGFAARVGLRDGAGVDAAGLRSPAVDPGTSGQAGRVVRDVGVAETELVCSYTAVVSSRLVRLVVKFAERIRPGSLARGSLRLDGLELVSDLRPSDRTERWPRTFYAVARVVDSGGVVDQTPGRVPREVVLASVGPGAAVDLAGNPMLASRLLSVPRATADQGSDRQVALHVVIGAPPLAGRRPGDLLRLLSRASGADPERFSELGLGVDGARGVTEASASGGESARSSPPPTLVPLAASAANATNRSANTEFLILPVDSADEMSPRELLDVLSAQLCVAGSALREGLSGVADTSSLDSFCFLPGEALVEYQSCPSGDLWAAPGLCPPVAPPLLTRDQLAILLCVLAVVVWWTLQQVLVCMLQSREQRRRASQQEDTKLVPEFRRVASPGISSTGRPGSSGLFELSGLGDSSSSLRVGELPPPAPDRTKGERPPHTGQRGAGAGPAAAEPSHRQVEGTVPPSSSSAVPVRAASPDPDPAQPELPWPDPPGPPRERQERRRSRSAPRMVAVSDTLTDEHDSDDGGGSGSESESTESDSDREARGRRTPPVPPIRNGSGLQAAAPQVPAPLSRRSSAGSVLTSGSRQSGRMLRSQVSKLGLARGGGGSGSRAKSAPRARTPAAADRSEMVRSGAGLVLPGTLADKLRIKREREAAERRKQPRGSTSSSLSGLGRSRSSSVSGHLAEDGRMLRPKQAPPSPARVANTHKKVKGKKKKKKKTKAVMSDD